jgi:ankyrin repeat protein
MSSLDDFADAIEKNDLSRINALLTDGAIDINARLPRPRKSNPPALVLAARLGRIDVVPVLLRFGARIDETDERGCTACHVSASGDGDVLELLLAHQPRPNLGIRCLAGRTALDVAFPHESHGNTYNGLMLINAGASVEHVAIGRLCLMASMSVMSLQVLLARGVDVTQLHDGDDDTPLHRVGRLLKEDFELLEMLITCGVDLEARNYVGLTCAHTTAACGNARSLLVLITEGADMESVDPMGRTPLFVARNYICTIFLLALGADVNARDSQGKTACHHQVAKIGDVIPALVAGGADLDIADSGGITVRQMLADRHESVDDDRVDTARRLIAKLRLNKVRDRALETCLGLQPLQLDALQMCVILELACGPLARVIAFHQWWKIATTVKHFKSSEKPQATSD